MLYGAGHCCRRHPPSSGFRRCLCRRLLWARHAAGGREPGGGGQLILARCARNRHHVLLQQLSGQIESRGLPSLAMCLPGGQQIQPSRWRGLRGKRFSFSQADDGQDLLADKLPSGVRIHAVCGTRVRLRCRVRIPEGQRCLHHGTGSISSRSSVGSKCRARCGADGARPMAEPAACIIQSRNPADELPQLAGHGVECSRDRAALPYVGAVLW